MKKTFAKTLATAAVITIGLVSLFAFKVPKPENTKTVSSVVVFFKTTSNDKDDNTFVDVTFKKKDDLVVADKLGISGHWNNNTQISIALEVKGTHELSDLSGSTLAIHISPTGNDKWEFDYDLFISFSDGSKMVKSSTGKTLTQDNRDSYDAVY